MASTKAPAHTFRKSLAKYYEKWFRDCYDSADYCMRQGDTERADEYRREAARLFDLINENWDAIEYFSVGDRSGLYDRAHPVEFRGYE